MDHLRRALRRSMRPWHVSLLALLLVGCDHGTKLAAVRLLGEGPRSLIAGVLELRYAENHDVAFSALSALHLPTPRAALIVVGVLVLGALVASYRALRNGRPRADVGFALVVAGAVGNLLDRVVRGYVVDFVHLAHWPVFNVADVLIAVGGILLATSLTPKKRAGP